MLAESYANFLQMGMSNIPVLCVNCIGNVLLYVHY
jgi:hypothetical protein